MRIVQGLGAGAEYGGAVIYLVENAPANHRGFWGGFAPLGVSVGNLLAAGAFALVSMLPHDAMMSWGWRLPFLASFVLILVGLYVRLRITETPVFTAAVLARGMVEKNPAMEAIRCFAVAADGKMTYYGHTDQGAEMAFEMMRRMRRSRAVQDRVAYLVRDHLRLTMAPRMRPATLKRMITEDGFDELMQLAMLDALASSSYLGFYHLCRRALAELGAVETRPPRLIGGDDLIAMGFKPGPDFKEILREVEDLQLDGAIATREEALAFVRENYPSAPGSGPA